MYCSKCGNLVLDNAKFCQKCGNPLSVTDEKQPDFISPILPQEKHTSVKRLALFVRGNPVAGFLIALLLGLYASVVIPAFGGIEFDATRNGSSVMFMSGIVFAYLWKRRDLSPWKGLGIGIIVAIFVSAIAGGINGFINGFETSKQTAEKNVYDDWKARFIKECSAGVEAKKVICTCVAEKSNPKTSDEEIADKIVPICLKKYASQQ